MKDNEIKMLVDEEKKLIELELKDVPIVTSKEFDYACEHARKLVEMQKNALLMHFGKISPNTKQKVKDTYNALSAETKSQMSTLAVWEYQLKKFIETYGVPGGKPISVKEYYDQLDDIYGQMIALLETEIDSLVSRIKKIGVKEEKRNKKTFVGKNGYVVDTNKKVKKQGEPSQESERV